jgi:hypothetical protein
VGVALLWTVLFCNCACLINAAPRSFSNTLLSRVGCDIDTYTAAWFVADRSIRVLERQHVEFEKLVNSKRTIQNNLTLKCAARKLQRKSDLLERLVESFKTPNTEPPCYTILKRNAAPLYEHSARLWVESNQF